MSGHDIYGYIDIKTMLHTKYTHIQAAYENSYSILKKINLYRRASLLLFASNCTILNRICAQQMIQVNCKTSETI